MQHIIYSLTTPTVYYTYYAIHFNSIACSIGSL